MGDSHTGTNPWKGLAGRRALLIGLVALDAVLLAHFILHLHEVVSFDIASLVGLAFWMPAILFLFVHRVGMWILYLNFRRSEPPPAPPGLSVDVFLTVCNEGEWLIRKSLRAAVGISYPHRTYLLDDSRDPRKRRIAEELGAEYLTRPDNRDFKAGNINAALGRTSGELVAIFDVDHAARPDFLDRTLGFFADPGIGFVQAMQTFFNGGKNLVSRAAAETTYEYFNIAAACKDRLGAASLHGTNAVIRRAALESVGGYNPGLAEDLETSVALHARGWRSRYVCEPLAPGMVPETLAAFWIQQLKWSRGVFEAALNSVKKGYVFKLSWGQRLAYAVRFSYYLVGVTIFLGSLVFAASLASDRPDPGYERFLATLLALTLVAAAIRMLMLKTHAVDPEARTGFQWRGASIVFSSWPIYLYALFCVCLRIPLRFMHTPKDSRGRLRAWTLAPQGALVSLMLLAAWKGAAGPKPFALGLVLLYVACHWILAAIPFADRIPDPSLASAPRGGGPLAQ